jgi:hypothetical protein
MGKADKAGWAEYLPIRLEETRVNPTFTLWTSRADISSHKETNGMRREIQGLEALEQQIARGLEAMKLRRVSVRVTVSRARADGRVSRNVNDSPARCEENCSISLACCSPYTVSLE